MVDPFVDFHQGNCLDVLPQLQADSVQMVVTSPPYWGLRKYDGQQEYIWNNHNGCEHEWGSYILIDHRGLQTNTSKTLNGPQREDARKHVRGNLCSKCGAWKGAYGLEPTIDLYVEHTVEILRAIKRVLRPDGVVWWNIGDSYAGSGGPGSQCDRMSPAGYKEGFEKYRNPNRKVSGLKPKDLCLIPFRIALAAQAAGWYVRSVIIWNKPNPMPESVKDRPTESHEYILMLTKSKHYYFDMEAVREPAQNWGNTRDRSNYRGGTRDPLLKHHGLDKMDFAESGRNIRSVWDITTQPFKEAHFATFPEEIPRRCILASTSETGNCEKCGKPWVRIVEPSEEYAKMLGKSMHNHENDDIRGWSQHKKSVNAEYKTLGWLPSCKCDAGIVRPVVLDPFGGSVTTSKVAKELGRKSIYIDTSEKYLEMARKRIQLVTLPMELNV